MHVYYYRYTNFDYHAHVVIQTCSQIDNEHCQIELVALFPIDKMSGFNSFFFYFLWLKSNKNLLGLRFTLNWMIKINMHLGFANWVSLQNSEKITNSDERLKFQSKKRRKFGRPKIIFTGFQMDTALYYLYFNDGSGLNYIKLNSFAWFWIFPFMKITI